MARGFGTTDGVGTTDSVETTLTAYAAQRTYAFWIWQRSSGGGGNGRLIDKRVSGAETELLYSDAAGLGFSFIRARDVTPGGWGWTPASLTTQTWHHIAVTYDSGSTANDPVLYFNGSVETPTEFSTPDGALVDTSDAYVIGNRKTDNARNWDGRLADVAIWDRLLTADEIAGLAKGISPLAYLPSLVEYLPFVRETQSVMRAAPTVTGTAVQDHPRIYLPSWTGSLFWKTAASINAWLSVEVFSGNPQMPPRLMPL